MKLSKKQLQEIVKEEIDSYLLLLEWTTAPSMEKVFAGNAVLSMGMKGPAVSAIQAQLGIPSPDGKFDGGTKKALIAYQNQAGLSPDGVLGKNTAHRLSGRVGAPAGAITQPKGPFTLAGSKDIDILSSHLGSLSYVDDENMKEIYTIVKKYNSSPESMGALIQGYEEDTGDNLAQEIADISGVEEWKRRALGLLGVRYEKDLTTRAQEKYGSLKGRASKWLSSLFAGKAAKKELSAASKRNAYLLLDNDALSWVVGGDKVKSWPATTGKVWFVDPKRRDQSKKAFGPIPEGRYGTGGIQTMERNVGDPGLFSQATYLVRELLSTYVPSSDVKPAPHNWGVASGKNAVFSQIAWGSYRVPIRGGRLGRGGFYIHGGSLKGSAGCIDLGDEMDDFAKFWSVNVVSKGSGPSLRVDYGGEKEKKDTVADAASRRKGKNLKRV